MSRSPLRIPAATFLLFPLISTNASADSVDPPLVISATAVCASQQNGTGSCPSAFNRVQTSQPVSVSGTYTPFPGVNITASGLGQAGFGVLKANASASFNIVGTPTAAYSWGVSAFRDVMTISFAPWNGSPGLLLVGYNLNGTINASANGTAGLNVATIGGPTDTQTMYQNYTSSVSGIFGAPAPIQFIYGQPFNLGLELWAEAGTRGSVVGIFPGDWAKPTTGTGSASADFSDTLILSGLIPTDVNGNQAVGAQFSSASGTVYTTDGVVPEPATAFLLFSGLCLCVACRQNLVSIARPHFRGYAFRVKPQLTATPLRATTITGQPPQACHHEQCLLTQTQSNPNTYNVIP